MKAEPFVVSPKTYEPALNVLGVSVTVLASNIQTQGYEMTLQSGGEDIGPPPHRHVWDESFFVLRGKVEFSIDGKADLCGPGTLVHLPAGTVHSYRFGAGGVSCSRSPVRAATPHECSPVSVARSRPVRPMSRP